MAKVVDQKVVITTLDRTRAGFRSAERNASNFGRSIGSLRTQLLGLTTVLSAGVLGREIVRTGLAMERLNAGFKLTEGSVAGATRALGFVANEAERLGFNAISTSTAFLKISAAARGTAVEGEGVRQIFLGVLEAGRALALNSVEIDGALKAVEQIMSKGKVSAEELRQQLSERLPGAFQIAARAIGATTAELNDMLERGEVISEEFLPLFARQLRTEFGEAAEDAADNAAASFARFSNAVDELSAAIAESGVLDFLSDLATESATAIRQLKLLGVELGIITGSSADQMQVLSSQILSTSVAYGKLLTKIQETEESGSDSEIKRLGQTRLEAARLGRELDELRTTYKGLADAREASATQESGVAAQLKKDKEDARALTDLIKQRRADRLQAIEDGKQAKRDAERQLREQKAYAKAREGERIREREVLLDGLEETRTALQSDTEKLREVFAARGEILNQSVALNLISEQNAAARRVELEQQLHVQLAEIRLSAASEEAERRFEERQAIIADDNAIFDAKVANLQRLNGVSRSIGQDAVDFEQLTGKEKLSFGKKVLQQSLSALGQNSKKAFKISKDFALADAIISTATGVARAFKDHTFPASLAVAAAVASAGFAQVQAIRASRPGSSAGGGVGAGVGGVQSAPEATTRQQVNITVIGPGRKIIEELIGGINDAVSDGVELKVA